MGHHLQPEDLGPGCSPGLRRTLLLGPSGERPDRAADPDRPRGDPADPGDPTSPDSVLPGTAGARAYRRLPCPRQTTPRGNPSVARRGPDRGSSDRAPLPDLADRERLAARRRCASSWEGPARVDGLAFSLAGSVAVGN